MGDFNHWRRLLSAVIRQRGTQWKGFTEIKEAGAEKGTAEHAFLVEKSFLDQ